MTPPASRSQGVLLFDSSPRLDLESLHVQAVELGLRRAGFRTLLLAFDLPPERVVRAIRALDPTAFVFCGGEATLEVVGRLVYTVRQVGSAAPVFEYREAMPVTGDHGIPSLGSTPIEAVERLKGYVDSGRIDQATAVPGAEEEAASAAPRPGGARAPGRLRHKQQQRGHTGAVGRGVVDKRAHMTPSRTITRRGRRAAASGAARRFQPGWRSNWAIRSHTVRFRRCCAPRLRCADGLRLS